MRKIERETKYIIPDTQTYNHFFNDAIKMRFVVIENFRGPLSRADVYYDTPDLLLLQSNCSFRFGSKTEDLARLTFKERISDENSRLEIEDFLPTARALQSLSGEKPSPAVVALRQKIGQKRIEEQLHVHKFFFSFESNGCEIVFGPTVYTSKSGFFKRYDLEIEQRKGKGNEFKRLGKLFVLRYGLKEDARSKYEVGMIETDK